MKTFNLLVSFSGRVQWVRGVRAVDVHSAMVQVRNASADPAVLIRSETL